MYALLFAMLSSSAPSATTTAPVAPAVPVTKKVCQEIEVPMSRMKRRVCTKVVVKQPAPEPQETEEATAEGAVREPAGD